MIRLLLLLSAGLFLTLQIGGEDRGQKRFGLIEAERLAAERAVAAAKAPAPVVAENPVLRDAQVTQVAFVPALQIVQPVVTPVVTPAADVQPQPEESVVAEAAMVKYVTGRSVNVRSGPSTRDEVVGRLTRGEAVTVVWLEDNGWARIRMEGDGVDGYMAMDFLADAP